MKYAYLAGLSAAAFLGGCHHARTAITPEGSSSIQFLESPAPPAKQTATPSQGPQQPMEMMVVATPIAPLAKPEYPRTALGREKLPVQVAVRIIVDTTGRVSDVRMSLAGVTTPTPYAEEFRTAVEEALAQWRFRPAQLRRLKPTTDETGSARREFEGWEKVDCGFDVAFTFQSTGEVTSQVK